jgi:hypothetical protein
MAIYRLLQSSFGPEGIAALTDAYDRTLRKLNLVDGNDRRRTHSEGGDRTRPARRA